MARTILHCDCNGFYASVECALNPELKKVPMAVGGSVENRHGIILAKNELAKKYNVKTAETIHQAKLKCPDLVIVPPHHDLYREYSKRVFEIYTRYTELVESFGLDEAWLDVTGSRRLFGDGKTIADRLRREVREETGLTISAGVSFCKVFAKLGSDYKKPDATTVFSEENWRQFIFPMNVENLLYVGKSTLIQLNKLNIRTIGDLAAANPDLLATHIGKLGTKLYEYANGLDDEPVKSIYDTDEVKSVGRGKTFAQDLSGEEVLRAEIRALSEDIAKRMRKHGLKCRTVQLHIRDPKFKTISRQMKTEHPTYLAKDICETAMTLLKQSWNMRSPVRMLTVTGLNLIEENEVTEQISLFDDSLEKQHKDDKLAKTMDALSLRFGKDVFKNNS